MTARRLISKKSHPEDRRSIQVQIAAKGEEALLAVVPAAAELQSVMLAPLRKEDRAHFLKCLLAIAKARRRARPPARDGCTPAAQAGSRSVLFRTRRRDQFGDGFPRTGQERRDRTFVAMRPDRRDSRPIGVSASDIFHGALTPTNSPAPSVTLPRAAANWTAMMQ